MRVPVADLRGAAGNRQRADGSIDRNELPAPGEDARLAGPIRVSAELVNAGGEIVVDVRATATAVVPCARCLSPVELGLDARFRQLFRPGAPPMGGEQQEIADEDEVSYFQGDEIDLEPSVVENLALALPMKALCRPECRGICPTCGKDLNQGPCQCPVPIGDPRLAVLGDLLRDRNDRKD